VKSSFGDVAEVSLDVVTVTSTTPAPAGAAAVICVAETKVTLVAGTVPNLTVDAVVKPDPSIVTTLPPAAGPEVGLTLVTLGTYVNWSFDDVAEVSPDVVTVISTTPTVPAGAVAVICVAESNVTPVAGTVPNSTLDAVLNPDPVIVTTVPPAAGPELGLTAVTLGR
jgi:hypothetical protein